MYASLSCIVVQTVARIFFWSLVSVWSLSANMPQRDLTRLYANCGETKKPEEAVIEGKVPDYVNGTYLKVGKVIKHEKLFSSKWNFRWRKWYDILLWNVIVLRWANVNLLFFVIKYTIKICFSSVFLKHIF